jgi:hypothetical protein
LPFAMLLFIPCLRPASGLPAASRPGPVTEKL